MSRTIRVQTVRSVAHNQQLFRCAVCAQCRARFAALPSRSLCAMWRAIRNSSVMQSVRSVAYKLRSSVAQCCAHCRAQSVCKLCAMPRTIRSSSVAQSVCNAAYNLLLFCRAVRVQCRAQLAAQCSASSRTIGCNGISSNPGVVRTASSRNAAAKRKTASGVRDQENSMEPGAERL